MLIASSRLVSSTANSTRIEVQVGVNPTVLPAVNGYTTYQFELNWNPLLASVDAASVKLIGNAANSDVSAFDANAIASGTLRAGGWSGSGGFSGASPLLTFQYTQTALAQVNFVVSEERFDNASYLSSQSQRNVIQVAMNAAGQAVTPVAYEAVPPGILNVSPSSAESVSALDTHLVVTFNEQVLKSSGVITLRSGASLGTLVESFNIATSPQVSLVNNVLTVNPSANLVAGTSYALVIPAGAVSDLSGNALPSASTFLFATTGLDKTPPTMVSANPASGALAVTDLNTPLAGTFSEAVVPKKGFIELRLGSASGSLFETFNVESSSRLVFSGNTVTLDPTHPLEAGKTYTWVVPAGAVADAAGNVLAAQASTTFTTATVALPLGVQNPDLKAVPAQSQLSLAQLQVHLPGVTDARTISQYTLGEVLVLKTSPADPLSPTGMSNETLVVSHPTQAATGAINDSALSLSVRVPAGLQLLSAGPSAAITPAQSQKYFDDLLEKYFPARSISAELGAYKATVSSALKDMAAHSADALGSAGLSATRLITPVGDAANLNLSLAGLAQERDFSVLNLFNLNPGAGVTVDNLSHLMVVGPGQVTATGAATYLAADGNNQTLSGGAGNDVIRGGGGTDVVTGGAGRDTFVIGTHGHLTLKDFTADDVMQFAIPGVRSLSDLVSRVTAGFADAQSVSYTFDTGLVVTLVGKTPSSVYTAEMFAFSA